MAKSIYHNMNICVFSNANRTKIFSASVSNNSALQLIRVIKNALIGQWRYYTGIKKKVKHFLG